LKQVIEQRLKYWVVLYTERLVRVAYMYVKDQSTAEDRVQDAFIKAYHSMEKLKDPENPFPWLYRIVVNECKTYQKRSLRETVTSFLPEKIAKSAENMYLDKNNRSDIYNIVLSLPEKYKVPIVLYYFQDLQVQEIADLIGITRASVKIRLHRARGRLQKLLKEEHQIEFRREASES